MTFVMDTGVGPANVLHRLALGVEPLDSVTGYPLSTAVRVGQEVPPRLRTTQATFESYWPCLDFESNGTAKFKLRHGIGGPNRIKVNADGSPPQIVVRIDDERRRLVPRRFRIPVWTRLELQTADPTDGDPPAGPYVAMASRLVRPMLFPGSAYSLPRMATVLRGSVIQDGRPLRWPRVLAKVDGMDSGIAHGDDRGEFVLVLASEWTLLAAPPEYVNVSLTVRTVPRAMAPAPDPDDRLADLVIEDVSRPLPTDAALSGAARPAGYQDHPLPAPVKASVGRLTNVGAIVFQP